MDGGKRSKRGSEVQLTSDNWQEAGEGGEAEPTGTWQKADAVSRTRCPLPAAARPPAHSSLLTHPTPRRASWPPARSERPNGRRVVPRSPPLKAAVLEAMEAVHRRIHSPRLR